MSRQSPCHWNQSQWLVPYTSPWKDSQDYSYCTDWLIQLLLFHIFLKATGSQHFSQQLSHVSRAYRLTPSPSAFGVDWRCSLGQLVVLGTCCHVASGCKLFGAARWEGHNQLRVSVGYSERTVPRQHNRISSPWSLLPLHTRVGSRLAPASGSQLPALAAKSQTLLKHRENLVWVTAAQFRTIILSVRHLCSWL